MLKRLVAFIGITIVSVSAISALTEAEVIIWKPGGFNTVVDLINAGNRDPAVLARYSNCVVNDGTRVQIQASSGTQGIADVLVVEGPSAGCQGRIPIEYLSRLKLP